jgi:PQQ system protein
MRRSWVLLTVLLAGLTAGSCEYVKLLRPSVLKQLNPDVVRLVNFLPSVDNPNEAIVARLFAHGGLSNAKLGSDGIMRDRIYVPRDEYIWKPAIIVMPRAGDLELKFANADQAYHVALLPTNGDRMVLELPRGKAGSVRVHLDQPGYYWFGCPVGNHATRGMLGLIIVKGNTPAEARLDRPAQKRP